MAAGSALLGSSNTPNDAHLPIEQFHYGLKRKPGDAKAWFRLF